MLLYRIDRVSLASDTNTHRIQYERLWKILMNIELTESSNLCLDCYVILMTKKLHEQQQFYQNIIGLTIIFQTQDAIGLGRDRKVFLLLKYDHSEDSHHLAVHKGSSILTFKLAGDIDQWRNKVKQYQLTLRDQLLLPAYQTGFLFIEDYEGNEICLAFDKSIPVDE